jgi:hypothetical protein
VSLQSRSLRSLDQLRKGVMTRLEDGDIPAVDTELTHLIEAVGPGRDPWSWQLIYYLYQDRATVRRRANRWDEALADLAVADATIDRLSFGPSLQALARATVVHARAVILSEPMNPKADVTEAVVQIARLRQSGHLGYAADDLESRLACRACEWGRASTLARRAAATLADQGWPAAAATCRRRAAEALLASGDLAAAETELQAARQQVDEFGTPVDLAYTDLVHARILSARGAHDEAWQRASRALDQFDALIHHFAVPSDQQRFLIDKLERYAEAFAVGLAAGGDRGIIRAWSVAERSKSFYLCQLLASANACLFEGVDATALKAYRAAGEELDRLERRHGTLSDANREGRVGRELVARVQEVSRRKLTILQDLMRSNPRWARVAVPGGFDVIDEIAHLPEGWTLLSYYWQYPGPTISQGREGGKLHLFWADESKRPRHLISEWTPMQLALLRATRARLAGNVDIDAGLVPEALCDSILPPLVRSDIPEGAGLLISPHGPLQLLPLHAMTSDSGDYVCERWALQYLPTFALLPLARAATRREPVLLVGCVENDFGDVPIPHVADELKALSEVWSAPSTGRILSKVIPKDGSPDDLGVGIQEWVNFGILHVACHGVFPAGRPFDAALRLGSRSIQTSDCFGVRLDGAIASFSACSLARHADTLDELAVVGDEWIGFYLPLLYAGVRCIVASLWDAFSEQAGQFMGFLHLALKRGDDPADAVRWAQDRAASRSPYPATWANWYVVGLPARAAGRSVPRWAHTGDRATA